MKKSTKKTTPLVAILMGSPSDKEIMQPAAAELKKAKIPHEIHVMSAHREPEKVAEFAKGAKDAGLKVVIAGAGLAAALPGVVASYTDLPVIGVPIAKGTLGGLDALLAISQMPPGVPVATVGVNNAKNAALLALKILKLAES